MPTRQEEVLREDLADEFLKYDATEQKLEVRMYNRGIQPEQDECVSERMVNYCQEYVKVEVCGREQPDDACLATIDSQVGGRP